MNTNVFLRCKHCNDLIHARIGFSNQEKQIFRFACGKCVSPIFIQLDVDFENVTWKGEIEGGTEVQDMWPDKVDQSDQFVDLHLDFPTYHGKYEKGITPFIRAFTKLKDNLIPYQHRLEVLQCAVNDKKQIEAIIRFYITGNTNLFEQTIRQYLDEKAFPCREPVDINRALYQFLCLAFMSLLDPPADLSFVESLHNRLCKLYETNENNFGLFLQQIIGARFLQNLQTDCLQIYSRMIESNEIFRPALYYEYVTDNKKDTSLRIANFDFLKHKGLFQDIAEIISRQMILIAGINNISKRGNYDSFNRGVDSYPKTLDEFANYPFGGKSKYIDDSFWGDILAKVTNNQLRNAIAHNKVEYDEITQQIEFYYKQEGLKQQQNQNISYMDFSITLLESFRWLHRFNHIIKMLYVFWFLKYASHF